MLNRKFTTFNSRTNHSRNVSSNYKKMKIDLDLKLDIQCFSYFLFKGSLTPKLIINENNYVNRILSDSKLLFECFRIFAISKQRDLKIDANEIVANFILRTKKEPFKSPESDFIFNNFWKDFLNLSQRFCFNQFPKTITDFNIKYFDGLGTDAVPYFAVWTNVVEIDKNFNVLNSDYALNRANERLLTWNGNFSLSEFEEWEIEQDIY